MIGFITNAPDTHYPTLMHNMLLELVETIKVAENISWQKELHLCTELRTGCFRILSKKPDLHIHKLLFSVAPRLCLPDLQILHLTRLVGVPQLDEGNF